MNKNKVVDDMVEEIMTIADHNDIILKDVEKINNFVSQLIEESNYVTVYTEEEVVNDLVSWAKYGADIDDLAQIYSSMFREGKVKVSSEEFGDSDIFENGKKTN